MPVCIASMLTVSALVVALGVEACWWPSQRTAGCYVIAPAIESVKLESVKFMFQRLFSQASERGGREEAAEISIMLLLLLLLRGFMSPS